MDSERPTISFQKIVVRWSLATFEEVLALISTLIERRDTNYREAIPAGERLAVTLRFLATGQDTDAAVARSSTCRTTFSCSGVHCIVYTLSWGYNFSLKTDWGWRYSRVWNFCEKQCDKQQATQQNNKIYIILYRNQWTTENEWMNEWINEWQSHRFLDLQKLIN